MSCMLLYLLAYLLACLPACLFAMPMLDHAETGKHLP